MTQICFPSVGGLGDLIASYLGYGPFKYLKGLRESGVVAEFVCHNWTYNWSCQTIHELNPYYTGVMHEPCDDWNDEYNAVAPVQIQDIWDLSKLPAQQPKFYSTDEEEKFVDGIPRPFLALHHQASTSDRALGSHVDLKRTLTELTKRIPVVLLGGSSERKGEGTWLDETCQYKMDGLYNCVDTQLARVQCELAKRCHVFVGGMSAYSMVALYTHHGLHNIHTVPKTIYGKIKASTDPGYWLKYKREARNLCWDGEPDFTAKLLAVVGSSI